MTVSSLLQIKLMGTQTCIPVTNASKIFHHSKAYKYTMVCYINLNPRLSISGTNNNNSVAKAVKKEM